MVMTFLQGKLPFFVAPPKVLIEGVETGAAAMEEINDNDEDEDEDDDEVTSIGDGQNVVDEEEEEVDSIYDSDDDNIVDDDGDEVEGDDDNDEEEEDDEEEESNRDNVLEPTVVKDKRQVQKNSHHVVWRIAAIVKEHVVATD